jgi:hypothetical protein
MIERLRQQLSKAMNCWIAPEMLACPNMAKALDMVRRNFDNPVPPQPPVPPEKIVRDFWTTGTVDTFAELRYLCLSLEIVIRPPQKCLLDEPLQLGQLFALVQKHKSRISKFLKCYQGLLACYLNHQNTDNDTAGWTYLREFLSKEMQFFYQMSHQPVWLKILFENRQFLTPEPCERFSHDLAAGNTREFEEVCDGLGIMAESWIREEAILSRIEGTCSYPDDQFKVALDPLLALLSGNTVRLSERIILKCLASLLIRYQRCDVKDEHRPLRDSAINRIGNPWLHRPQWNVVVGHEPTRKMVDGWLKRQFIHDFFALLSEEGATDRRRLNHWLRYADQISDLWLVLGKDARENPRPPYRKLRELARSRIIHLERTTRYNNAFIMMINNIVIVEFGEKGNASYIFSADDLPFSLESKYLSCDRSQLKSLRCLHHLNHVDTSYGTWEENFDRELRPYLGRPTSATTAPGRAWGQPPRSASANASTSLPWPSLRELMKYVEPFGCGVRDDRAAGGALWIEWVGRAMKQIPSLSEQMTRWGFTYHENRGWWRKE